MAKKKKGELPSGNIRIQVFDYTDENGKKHYKSFTTRTKAEAQALATEWKNNRRELKEALTVSMACARYIEMKRNVLSPSTIKGYYTVLRRIQAHPISAIDLSVIKNTELQKFVSDLAVSHSPKYIRNVFGLLSAALAMFIPDFTVKVTLPQKVKLEYYTPSIKDVQILLDHCESPKVKAGILFAAVGTMRRGEACAVTFEDVNYENCTIRINKAVSETDRWEWVVHRPKTYDSYRTVRVPQYVIDLIKTIPHKNDSDAIIGLNPDQLYKRFRKALRASGLPPFRFHDLRHYAASQMHAYGVPDRYIEAIGGWKPGSSVLKRVYENVIDEERSRIEETFAKKNRFIV